MRTENIELNLVFLLELRYEKPIANFHFFAACNIKFSFKFDLSQYIRPNFLIYFSKNSEGVFIPQNGVFIPYLENLINCITSWLLKFDIFARFSFMYS